MAAPSPIPALPSSLGASACRAAPALPPEVAVLVGLCKSELGAVEVWLFGSRARGDHHEHSDHDILAVLPDDAPAWCDDPVAVFKLRRRSQAHADLLTVRLTDFCEAWESVNTLSHVVAKEGVRLDVGAVVEQP